MSIEDIKGYRPHTDDKIGKVNAIKDAEVRLGLIIDALKIELLADIELAASKSGLGNEQDDAEFDDLYERVAQAQKAKDKLKEASMWACRAVFRPEEKY